MRKKSLFFTGLFFLLWILDLLLNLIGLAGVPGDLNQWQAWLATITDFLAPYNQLFAILFIASAVIWASWNFIVVRFGSWLKALFLNWKFRPFKFDFENVANGSRRQGEVIYFSQFWLSSENKGQKAADVTFAEVRSNITGENLPFKIRTNAGYVTLGNSNPVPSGSTMYLHALLYDPGRENEREGIPEDEFYAKWNDFDIILHINGKERKMRIGPGIAYSSLLKRLGYPQPAPTVTARES